MLKIAIAWAGFVVAFAGFANGLHGVLVSLPFAGIPLWLALRRAKKSQTQLNDYVSRFLTALGHADEKMFHLAKYSSVGINPGAERLVLGDGATVKAYGFSEVREWVNHQELPTSLRALSSNAGQHNVAASRSGLLVRVKDLDRPEWLVTMDAQTRARWFELMTQSINERKS